MYTPCVRRQVLLPPKGLILPLHTILFHLYPPSTPGNSSYQLRLTNPWPWLSCLHHERPILLFCVSLFSLHSCPQVLQSTADWLSRDMGYRAYTVDWASSMLYRPFPAVYFGCAYLTWLSSYGGKYRILIAPFLSVLGFYVFPLLSFHFLSVPFLPVPPSKLTQLSSCGGKYTFCAPLLCHSIPSHPLEEPSKPFPYSFLFCPACIA